MEFCIEALPSWFQHTLTGNQQNCQNMKENFAAWFKTLNKYMD